MQIAFEYDARAHVRASGPDTSVEAAHAMRFRAGSEAAALLRGFMMAGADGLTDEQAGEGTGLLENNPRWDYTKRCADLRGQDFIMDTGARRRGRSGRRRMVCVITRAGLEALDNMGGKA